MPQATSLVEVGGDKCSSAVPKESLNTSSRPSSALPSLQTPHVIMVWLPQSLPWDSLVHSSCTPLEAPTSIRQGQTVSKSPLESGIGLGIHSCPKGAPQCIRPWAHSAAPSQSLGSFGETDTNPVITETSIWLELGTRVTKEREQRAVQGSVLVRSWRQDQLLNLWEPVQNEMWAYCSNTGKDFRTATAEIKRSRALPNVGPCVPAECTPTKPVSARGLPLRNGTGPQITRTKNMPTCMKHSPCARPGFH